MPATKDPEHLQELTREEMHLVEFPIGLISDRLPKDPETGKEITKLTVEKWLVLPDGERVRQEWTVAAPDLHGLPRGFDFCVLFLLIQLWVEQGMTSKRVDVGNIYRILKRMRLSDEKHSYDRVRQALARFIGVSYYTRHAIWNPKKRTFIPKLDFNILSQVRFDSEEEIEELGVSRPSGFVEFTDALVFLARNGYFKTTDATLYWSLPTPYDRRLFQLLDKRRTYGKVQRFEIFSFAKKLGTHDMTLRQYKPKDIRKIMTPHLDLLVTEPYRYLEGFGWPREGRRTYLEVCYAGEFPEALTSEGQKVVDAIVDTFDDEGSRRYYELTVAELGVSKVRELFHVANDAWGGGSIKNPGAYFVSLAQPAREAAAKKRQAQKVVKACGACNEYGMLELRENITGRIFVHQCPHEAKRILAIQQRLNAEIVNAF